MEAKHTIETPLGDLKESEKAGQVNCLPKIERGNSKSEQDVNVGGSDESYESDTNALGVDDDVDETTRGGDERIDTVQQKADFKDFESVETTPVEVTSSGYSSSEEVEHDIELGHSGDDSNGGMRSTPLEEKPKKNAATVEVKLESDITCGTRLTENTEQARQKAGSKGSESVETTLVEVGGTSSDDSSGEEITYDFGTGTEELPRPSGNLSDIMQNTIAHGMLQEKEREKKETRMKEEEATPVKLESSALADIPKPASSCCDCGISFFAKNIGKEIKKSASDHPFLF